MYSIDETSERLRIYKELKDILEECSSTKRSMEMILRKCSIYGFLFGLALHFICEGIIIILCV